MTFKNEKINQRIEEILETGKFINRKSYTYTQIEDCVIGDSIHFDVYDKAVYSCLFSFTSKDEMIAAPGFSTIMQMTGVGKTKLIESIKKLEYLGLLEVFRKKENGKNEVNVYAFNDVPEKILLSYQLCRNIKHSKEVKKQREEFKQEFSNYLKSLKQNQDEKPAIAEKEKKVSKVEKKEDDKINVVNNGNVVNQKVRSLTEKDEIELIKLTSKLGKEYILTDKQVKRLNDFVHVRYHNNDLLDYLEKVNKKTIYFEAKQGQSLLKAFFKFYKKFGRVPSEKQVNCFDKLLKTYSPKALSNAISKAKNENVGVCCEEFLILVKEQEQLIEEAAGIFKTQNYVKTKKEEDKKQLNNRKEENQKMRREETFLR